MGIRGRWFKFGVGAAAGGVLDEGWRHEQGHRHSARVLDRSSLVTRREESARRRVVLAATYHSGGPSRRLAID